MKLFLTLFITSALLFAESNTDIEKKLNYLIKRMNKMEKQLGQKDSEIKQLRQEVKKQKIDTKKEFMTKSCDKILVKNFNYKYHKNVLPYYNLSYNLENDYPYGIKSITGKIYVEDSDGITILTDFIDKQESIPSKSQISIKSVHSVQSDLEKTMAQEKLSSLKVTFKPTTIIFKNSKRISCGGMLGSNLW